MGVVVYISLLLLIFCLVRAARSQLPDDPSAIDPRNLPDSVHRAARRAARGIVVTRARVTLRGANGLRYRIHGLLPDGRELELDIHDDGSVYRHDPPSAAPPLPDAVSRRLRQSLPAFRPRPGAVRLVSRKSALWYEFDGLTTGGKPASLRISPDGKAFNLTVSDPAA